MRREALRRKGRGREKTIAIGCRAPMTFSAILLLLVAGVAGGATSTLIGGAAMFTYPALLAVGLSPVTATAVNLISLTPGNLIAALDDRGQLPRFDRPFVTMVLVSMGGAGAGAMLLMWTPEKVFASFIPVLLGFATILFGLAERISHALARRSKACEPSERYRWSRTIPALLPVSLYGGYFGAGAGVLFLAVISVGTGGSYRPANAIKNLIIGLNSIIAASVFCWQGVVDWPAAFAMSAGATVGGFFGGRLGQVLPRWAARAIVISVGLILTVMFARHYWF